MVNSKLENYFYKSRKNTWAGILKIKSEEELKNIKTSQPVFGILMFNVFSIILSVFVGVILMLASYIFAGVILVSVGAACAIFGILLYFLVLESNCKSYVTWRYKRFDDSSTTFYRIRYRHSETGLIEKYFASNNERSTFIEKNELKIDDYELSDLFLLKEDLW